MLRIVYPICCGIDVHKTLLVATIAKTNEHNLTTYVTERFSTFTNDLLRLVQWLERHHCQDVCMESTGKYWILVYNILEPCCHLVLAHPKYINAIRGKKMDKKDSVWIADLFKHDLVAGSFIPGKEIRNLRDVMRYRFKLVHMKCSEKNRYQNSLTLSNFPLASVVSDVFGTPERSTPWAGLAPCNDQSAGKKKSTKISRASIYLKPILVQCALAAIRNKHFPQFSSYYHALKKRRGHKKRLSPAPEKCSRFFSHCFPQTSLMILRFTWKHWTDILVKPRHRNNNCKSLQKSQVMRLSRFLSLLPKALLLPFRFVHNCELVLCACKALVRPNYGSLLSFRFRSYNMFVLKMLPLDTRSRRLSISIVTGTYFFTVLFIFIFCSRSGKLSRFRVAQ